MKELQQVAIEAQQNIGEITRESEDKFSELMDSDAVKHPEFNRADLKAVAASEVDIQEGRTHSSEEIKTEYGREDTSER